MIKKKSRYLSNEQQKIGETYNSNEFSACLKYVSGPNKLLEKNLAQINESLEIFEVINSKLKIFKSPIFEICKIFNDFDIKIKETLKMTTESLLLLANYGWYLNFENDINLANDLAELIKAENIEDVDKFLSNYYSDNLEHFILKLETQFPDRKEIFNQIYSAHYSELYYGTIPSILTQIDGLCDDSFEKKFFLRNKNFIPKVTEEIKKENSPESFFFISS